MKNNMWEYTAHVAPYEKSIVDEMQALGDAGWEIFQIDDSFEHTDGWILYAKRQKNG